MAVATRGKMIIGRRESFILDINNKFRMKSFDLSRLMTPEKKGEEGTGTYLSLS